MIIKKGCFKFTKYNLFYKDYEVEDFIIRVKQMVHRIHINRSIFILKSQGYNKNSTKN